MADKLAIKNGRKRYKSIVAAYVSGKLPLHKIVHPSRLTAKNLHFDLLNHLDLNGHSFTGKPLRANCRKRPLLRDYIRGIVPVTAMLAPEKITDISAKREEQKKIERVLNFPDWDNISRFSSLLSRNIKNTWKSTANSATALLTDDENNTRQRKIINESSTKNESKSAKISVERKDVKHSRNIGTNTHDNAESIKSIWTSLGETNDSDRDEEIGKATSKLSKTENEIKDNEEESLPTNASVKKNESFWDSKFEYKSAKEELFVSIEEELPPGEGHHNPMIKARKSKQFPAASKLDMDFVRHTLPQIYLQKYFIALLKNHECVEKRLLKQIICLRKDRDRFRNSYDFLRKIHKILADRWYQFRRISVD